MVVETSLLLLVQISFNSYIILNRQRGFLFVTKDGSTLYISTECSTITIEDIARIEYHHYCYQCTCYDVG